MDAKHKIYNFKQIDTKREQPMSIQQHKEPATYRSYAYIEKANDTVFIKL